MRLDDYDREANFSAISAEYPVFENATLVPVTQGMLAAEGSIVSEPLREEDRFGDEGDIEEMHQPLRHALTLPLRANKKDKFERDTMTHPPNVLPRCPLASKKEM